MARGMHDTTEIYRAVVKWHWRSDNRERLDFHGPYAGPSGKGQARRRLSDQYNPSLVIEGKVQKLTCRHDGSGSELQWVDVDD